MKLNLDDTIAAISTPAGEGGIGIVRISGKEARQIADRIFFAKDQRSPLHYKTYTTHYGWIVNSSKDSGQKTENRKQKTEFRVQKNNRPADFVDEVILTVMRAPKSYTKEDVVEINCHGGIVALRRVLELVLSYGARIASPGEFTRRAFMNGRIDLTQAEAVLDVIRARTDKCLNIALHQLKGRVILAINNIRRELLELLAQLNAAIDFPDEDLTIQNRHMLRKGGGNILKEINQLLKNSEGGQALREGVRTVICGRPNVGKSSLMNALLKKDRMIVTSLPGTTRDAVEEVVNIRGIPLKIADTAGIIETASWLEKESVAQAKEYINIAELAIFVLAGDERLHKDDWEIFNLLKNKKLIIVINKIDLRQKIDEKRLTAHTNGSSLVRISAKNFTGLEKIEQAIEHLIWHGQIPQNNDELITNIRQANLLREAKAALSRALEVIDDNFSEELAAVDVKETLDILGEITGETTSPDMLEIIFSQFCVGK
ncbi:MAG: tRNA uridine-5-carboxymethylaminomethyl(34) synthesis GTPase MnmE [Candidatus Omnitrophota bacterium]